ncbi:MAG: glycosyltransferase family 2 protein [Candidatus Delongbacteria bacterium]|nr:glycosyltransferase family 2 protein [Candidatus Delongbacteria bacterium]
MIDILLSTYNGEKFIEAQLKSIFTQTNRNFKLLIRDDNSIDNTIEILKKWKIKFPKQIEIFKGENNLGAKESFNWLLQKSEAEYIMFCDQDDVWLDNKIGTTLLKMKEYEALYPNLPILIHTDLTVVNENLQSIKKSFLDNIFLSGRFNSLKFYLIGNNVTGCTVMINKKCLELVSFIPEKALMHDWWLALFCSLKGMIGFIDIQTILYRQHRNNKVGASSSISKLSSIRHYIKAIKSQSDCFCEIHKMRKLNTFLIITYKIYYHLRWLLLYVRKKWIKIKRK